jgi:mannose-1-phosphate guanylyltransferase
MSEFYACVMAGGSGERFWPLSRRHQPKHLLKLFSERTLLEEAVHRVQGILPLENIFVLTNHLQVDLVRATLPFLPTEQIIIEPAKRDTAPVAALATAIAKSRCLSATVALLTADALIKDTATFQEQLLAAFHYASRNAALVTFSITATYPATGFGYLKLGQSGGSEFIDVEEFVEKPVLSLAEKYCNSGDYGWNSGIFVWQVETFIRELASSDDLDQARLLQFIQGFPQNELGSYLAKHFTELPKVSVDYAVMERAQRVVALKAKFDWDDVGTWGSLPKHLGSDRFNNTLVGNIYLQDSSDNIVIANGRVIALCGVNNIIVAETKDAILVCHRNRTDDLKKLVSGIPLEAT